MMTLNELRTNQRQVTWLLALFAMAILAVVSPIGATQSNAQESQQPSNPKAPANPGARSCEKMCAGLFRKSPSFLGLPCRPPVAPVVP
jgi:hypothetical protein